jgi:hypothetical protein
MTDNAKITPSDLKAHADVLIALGKMPTLEKLLEAVSSVREVYKPKIEAARKRRRQRR